MWQAGLHRICASSASSGELGSCGGSAQPTIPYTTPKSADSIAERLLAAAKTDNEAMLEEAIADLEDINGTDGCVAFTRRLLSSIGKSVPISAFEPVACPLCDILLGSAKGDDVSVDEEC